MKRKYIQIASTRPDMQGRAYWFTGVWAAGSPAMEAPVYAAISVKTWVILGEWNWHDKLASYINCTVIDSYTVYTPYNKSK